VQFSVLPMILLARTPQHFRKRALSNRRGAIGIQLDSLEPKLEAPWKPIHLNRL
jgi:hypothetical protein